MELVIKKNHETDKVIALGGNPNVGKSTIFNELTGLKQHTGNWPGKTVTNAQGHYTYKENGEKNEYVLVDLPGCYSLMAHSAEEEAARDFICFGRADAIIVICDATCLERGLNLVLQTMEMAEDVIVCINLMDEAKKKKIRIDLQAISERLGVPVIGTSARGKKGLDILMRSVKQVIDNKKIQKSDKGKAEKPKSFKVQYPDYVESAISMVEPHVKYIFEGNGNDATQNIIDTRWLSLLLLHWDEGMHGFINENLGFDISSDENINSILGEVKENFESKGITEKQIKDDIVSSLIHAAESICKNTIVFENKAYKKKDMRIDHILTGKRTAFPIMFLALLAVFWLTITGANYPSQVISSFLFWIEDKLLTFFVWINAPQFLYEMIVLGVYRVLAWVVSVMLPPITGFTKCL